MTDAQQPANWFADPTGRHQYRYWNGTEWTDHVADDQVTATDAPSMPGSGAAPAAGPEPAAPTAPATPQAQGAPLAAAGTPTPAGAPAPAPSPTPPQRAPKRRGSVLWACVAAIGGLALVAGSFLNALTATIAGIDIDRSYFDGDGPLELGIGILIIVLALLVTFGVLSRGGAWAIFALGVLGALVAVADIFDVKDTIDNLELGGASGSIGPALWLCLGGGILALLGGLLAFVLAPKTADAPKAAEASRPVSS